MNASCCQIKHEVILVRLGCIYGQVCLITTAESVLVHMTVAYRGSCSILCPSRPGWPNTPAWHSDSNSGRVSGPLGPSSRDSTSSSWPLAHSWERHWPGRGRGQWAFSYHCTTARTLIHQQHRHILRLWKYEQSFCNPTPQIRRI